MAEAPRGLVRETDNFFRRGSRQLQYILWHLYKDHLFQLIVCALIISIHASLLFTPLLDRLDYVALDLFFRLRPQLETHQDIAYVEIAEDSIHGIGRWPWPRHNHAVMTHILRTWGAKAIIFDILFSEPSNEFDDGALEQALSETDNVYLPAILESRGDKSVWIEPLPRFKKHAKGIGQINIFPDKDGTLRRVAPNIKYEGQKYYYMPIQVAKDLLGDDFSIRDVLDENGNFFINWAGRWEDTYAHFSFVDLVQSFAQVEAGETPLIDPSEIKDKIFIIGVTAAGLTDIKANPLEPAYPAIGVQSNILSGILTNQFIKQAPKKQDLIPLLVIGFLASFAFIIFKNLGSLLFGIFLGAMWSISSFFIFVFQGIWFSVVHPITLISSLFIFCVIFAFTTHKKERLHLFALATIDGLTGLYVIRYFRTLLNKAALQSRRKKKPMSVILMDIDFFKKVNDTYGHAAGDFILQKVAKIVQDTVGEIELEKESYAVGRYGGEEFIVLLSGVNVTDAAFKYAEKIRKNIEATTFDYEGTVISITISLGVSQLLEGENIPDPTVRRADQGLYRSKEDGRNRTSIQKFDDPKLTGEPENSTH